MISPRSALLLTLTVAALLPTGAVRAADPAPAAPEAAPVPPPVPVRIRVVKGIRDAKPWLDPRLDVLKKQLSTLAWQRWELVSDVTPTIGATTPAVVEIPDGAKVAISLLEVRGDIVKVEVAIPTKNTQSRVTTEKGQRIVHQVAKEKKGVALFLILTPWPSGP